MLSTETNLTAQWEEMLTKKCLIIQVILSGDSTVVLDELVVDLHPNFYNVVAASVAM